MLRKGSPADREQLAIDDCHGVAVGALRTRCDPVKRRRDPPTVRRRPVPDREVSPTQGTERARSHGEDRVRVGVRRELRGAWKLTDAHAAKRALDTLARKLERIN